MLSLDRKELNLNELGISPNEASVLFPTATILSAAQPFIKSVARKFARRASRVGMSPPVEIREFIHGQISSLSFFQSI